MAHSEPLPPCAEAEAGPLATGRHWRTRFVEQLAVTSNVDRSAEAAGITPARAYKLRRTDADFARQWAAALAEGYLHLEMEVVRRLREGDIKVGDGDRFDFANAIRLLAAHRGSSAHGQSQVRDVSVAEVRASIESKIDGIRRRMEREEARAEGRA